MAPAHALVPRPAVEAKPMGTLGHRTAPRSPVEFRFTSLDPREQVSRGRGLSTTVTTSFLIHGVLVVALVIIPLFIRENLPEPGEAVRAFFVSPTDVAPPPPPPPPPAAAPAVARVVKPTVPAAPIDTSRLIAPIEVPDQIRPEQSLDLGGVEGGVRGASEGECPAESWAAWWAGCRPPLPARQGRPDRRQRGRPTADQEGAAGVSAARRGRPDHGHRRHRGPRGDRRARHHCRRAQGGAAAQGRRPWPR